MKIYVSILACFFISFLNAQTVKVKKDKVLFDGVAVAKLSTKGAKYTYSSLDDSKSITVRLQSKEGGHDLFIKNPNAEEEKQVPMEWYSISMNLKKGVAELLAKKYQIITDNGIANIEEFFSESTEDKLKEDIVEEDMDAKIAAYEERLKNNKNVEKQQGYFIDKDGKKWEGKVTIEVEKLVDPREGDMAEQFSHKGAMSGQLNYYDEEGEARKKSFFASRGDKVCVINADNSETCYVGIKLKTDKLLTSDSNLSDAINSAYFYEIVYEGINSMVFKSPRDETEIGYKRKDTKEGFLILSKNKQRNASNLKRYFDCDFNEELLNADFTEANQITEVLKYYENNCR